MRAIHRVVTEKIMENTGTAGRPFYVKTGDRKWVYIFGVLIHKGDHATKYPPNVQ